MPDNIINKVPRITLVSPTSARTGKQYNQLVITFVNGYIFKTFLNDEQKFVIQNAIDSRDSTNNDLLEMVD